MGVGDGVAVAVGVLVGAGCVGLAVGVGCAGVGETVGIAGVARDVVTAGVGTVVVASAATVVAGVTRSTVDRPEPISSPCELGPLHAASKSAVSSTTVTRANGERNRCTRPPLLSSGTIISCDTGTTAHVIRHGPAADCRQPTATNNDTRHGAGAASICDCRELGRRRADSNRRSEFCRLLPCHLATTPGRVSTRILAYDQDATRVDVSHGHDPETLRLGLTCRWHGPIGRLHSWAGSAARVFHTNPLRGCPASPARHPACPPHLSSPSVVCSRAERCAPQAQFGSR